MAASFAIINRQLIAQTINFNSLNDLQDNFVVNGSNSNITYTSNQGLGGGALKNGTNINSDTIIYKTPYAFSQGFTISISVYWFNDLSLRDPFNQRRIIFLGLSDSIIAKRVTSGVWITTSTSGPQKTTTNLYSATTSSSTGNYSPATTWESISNHWYKTTCVVSFIRGEFNQIDISSFTEDYGETGFSPPILIPDSQNRYSFGSSYLASLSQIYPSISTGGQSGCSLLDNFAVALGEAKPSPRVFNAIVTPFVKISWDSLFTKNYLIEYSNELTTWHALTSLVSGVGGPMSVQDNASDISKRFYRITESDK